MALEKSLIGTISDNVKDIIEATLTCFSIAILGLVIYTSHLGGQLVFEHGAAVKVCTLAKECNVKKSKK